MAAIVKEFRFYISTLLNVNDEIHSMNDIVVSLVKINSVRLISKKLSFYEFLSIVKAKYWHDFVCVWKKLKVFLKLPLTDAF